MSALQDSLAGLFKFLDNDGLKVPTEDVWLFEVPSDVEVDDRGRLRVQRADFRLPQAFEARFDELLAAGFPWINMSCCGLDRDRLVISVETPQKLGRRSSRTSINYSGPTQAVRERGWDVGEALEVT